jgi:hypothetical protein
MDATPQTCTPAVLDELILSTWHDIEQHANNPVEADHCQLKHRLKPMRGLRTGRTAQTIIAGHAFMQNLRRGHYELGLDAPSATRTPPNSEATLRSELIAAEECVGQSRCAVSCRLGCRQRRYELMATDRRRYALW